MSKRTISNPAEDARDDQAMAQAVEAALDTSPAPVSSAPASDGERQPVFAARWARGRIGGTGTVLVFGQRARAEGRQIKYLDGDLKSASLRNFYGAENVSCPHSEDAVTFRTWALNHLDTMVEDRTSRLLDVSGGSDVMRDTLQELEIPSFCDSMGFRFTWLTVLGPDAEDFGHVRAAVDAGHLAPQHMLLVLNEGAIRRGQSPIGAFDPLISHPDFEALLVGGAHSILLPRLTIMDDCRTNRMDFYDTAAGRPNPLGVKPKATWTFMAGRWISEIEEQIITNGVQAWVP